jgi:hypothetical protein
VVEPNISYVKYRTFSLWSSCVVYEKKVNIYIKLNIEKKTPEETVILWTKENNLEYKIPRK